MSKNKNMKTKILTLSFNFETSTKVSYTNDKEATNIYYVCSYFLTVEKVFYFYVHGHMYAVHRSYNVKKFHICRLRCTDNI